MTRSQAHKSKEDPAHGNEKRKKVLGLTMEKESQACKKKKNKPWTLEKGG